MSKWLPIAGFPNYAVSDNGDVMNVVTGKELKPIRESTGYSHKPIASQIQYSLARSAEVRRKPVRNIDTGVEYPSIAECAKAENLRHSAISFHLTGKAKRPRFEYIDKGGLNTNE